MPVSVGIKNDEDIKELSPADKENIEMALDLMVLDAVLSGSWNNIIDPRYLVQAGINTGHGLFITCFLLW